MAAASCPTACTVLCGCSRSGDHPSPGGTDIHVEKSLSSYICSKQRSSMLVPASLAHSMCHSVHTKCRKVSSLAFPTLVPHVERLSSMPRGAVWCNQQSKDQQYGQALLVQQCCTACSAVHMTTKILSCNTVAARLRGQHKRANNSVNSLFHATLQQYKAAHSGPSSQQTLSQLVAGFAVHRCCGGGQSLGFDSVTPGPC